MRKLLLLTFQLMPLLWVISCADDPDCDQELPYDAVHVGFYDYDSLTKTELKFDLVATEGSDSLFYDRSDTLAVFKLNLNPSVDSVTYLFVTGVTIDSLKLKYSRKLEWLSEKCGPTMSYDRLEIVEHTFDSVSLVQPLIDLSVDENIKIYN
ncbi:DUF6452 family protein [Reichenbachiella agarivorans]|uniref:DUF6452 family protein n=1 Tax=Reichenbachiella agarivorans TaxID=2979464 RepID=A0ABY6CQV8_9BACT|nr:DUF6452 family protein [Reichenbachiella agarivorans]UXP32896.1 DUF6452 family protein [Reichenbachiella agarivorans]